MWRIPQAGGVSVDDVGGTTIAMTTVRKVILQLELEPRDVSVDAVRKKLHIDACQIDESFGVKQIRPDQNKYVVRVDADIAQALRGESAGTPEGGQVSVALVH